MDLSRYRAREVGFIFQSFHLVEVLTAAENVQIPLFEGTRPRKEWRRHAEQLLDSVGLLGHADKLPSQLSGGERQRVAIARSLANDPAVLLADEPTGNLDTETSHKILDLIRSIHRARQLTVVLVTHDSIRSSRRGTTGPAARRPSAGGSRAMTLFRVCIQTLRRRTARSLLTIAGLAIGIGALVTLLALAGGLSQSWQDLYRESHVDLVVLNATDPDFVQSRVPERVLAELRALPEVKGSGREPRRHDLV
jgi:hypothetical protein